MTHERQERNATDAEISTDLDRKVRNGERIKFDHWPIETFRSGRLFYRQSAWRVPVFTPEGGVAVKFCGRIHDLQGTYYRLANGCQFVALYRID